MDLCQAFYQARILYPQDCFLWPFLNFSSRHTARLQLLWISSRFLQRRWSLTFPERQKSRKEEIQYSVIFLPNLHTRALTINSLSIILMFHGELPRIFSLSFFSFFSHRKMCKKKTRKLHRVSLVNNYKLYRRWRKCKNTYVMCRAWRSA